MVILHPVEASVTVPWTPASSLAEQGFCVLSFTAVAVAGSSVRRSRLGPLSQSLSHSSLSIVVLARLLLSSPTLFIAESLPR